MGNGGSISTLKPEYKKKRNLLRAVHFTDQRNTLLLEMKVPDNLKILLYIDKKLQFEVALPKLTLVNNVSRPNPLSTTAARIN